MLQDCLKVIRERTDFVPDVALILGTGLGELAEEIDTVCTVDYHDLPDFPVSTAPGHKGRLVFGTFGKTKVVIMQGRVHYYEGYTKEQLRMPIRLLSMLGAKVLFLTNASGSVNRSYRAGDFMLMTDHIMTFFPNPLVGPNDEEFGTRFTDMSEAYDKQLREIILRTAGEMNIPMQQGVYCQLTGPSFETPAEIRMLERLGVDAVGMSTASEAVIARHAGMRVCAISCISNLGAGISENSLSAEEVFETANRVAHDFRRLVRGSIEAIGEELA